MEATAASSFDPWRRPAGVDCWSAFAGALPRVTRSPLAGHQLPQPLDELPPPRRLRAGRVQLELLGTCVDKAYAAYASSPSTRNPTHWSTARTRRVDRSKLPRLNSGTSPRRRPPENFASRRRRCAWTQCSGRAFFNLSARAYVSSRPRPPQSREPSCRRRGSSWCRPRLAWCESGGSTAWDCHAASTFRRFAWAAAWATTLAARCRALRRYPLNIRRHERPDQRQGRAFAASSSDSTPSSQLLGGPVRRVAFAGPPHVQRAFDISRGCPWSIAFPSCFFGRLS